MSKIKITEAQADMLASLPRKTVVKITTRQLNAIRESLGDNVTHNFKKEFAGQKPRIKFEGTLNESPTIELLELAKAVVEAILAELNNDTTNGLSPIFREMGITRGMLFTLLSDMGLIGMTFYQLTYNEKIRKIKSAIKPIASELMQMGKQAMAPKQDEMTGAASSGSFTGGMAMEPSKDYNDELAPSTQLGDGVLTDAESNFQELKGLEIGTEQEYFRVHDVRDKRTDAKGNVYFIVTLEDDKGGLSGSHLLYKYDVALGKAYIKFNHDFEKLVDVAKIIPQVYHANLKTIGKHLTKQAQLQDEATGAAGNTGAFDANAFAGMRSGSDVGGGMVSNIDVNDTNSLTSKEGSKPKDIRRESVDNMSDTAYPDGGFVEFDDCVKYNNNKEAENGGCNSGDSGVVKVKKSGKKSVISNQKGE